MIASNNFTKISFSPFSGFKYPIEISSLLSFEIEILFFIDQMVELLALLFGHGPLVECFDELGLQLVVWEKLINLSRCRSSLLAVELC